MIKLRQLQQTLKKLIPAFDAAAEEFENPMYLAWIIDCTLDGKAPEQSKRDKFSEVMRARRSPVFREFWNAYKDGRDALNAAAGQDIGIFGSDRVKYQKKFMKEFGGEIPF